MQKPKARTEFTSKDDECLHLLDCMCWITAEEMSLDLEMSQEDCADQLKQGVLEGRYVIDFDRAGDRVRLIPAPSLETH
jgi:hypothetical protein